MFLNLDSFSKFDLIILFEEVPLNNSVSKILTHHYTKNVIVNKILPFTNEQIGLGFLIDYEIENKKFQSLGALFSSSSSKFDIMIFDNKQFPFNNKVKPLHLIEWTKSSNKDSRNMLYQRFTKFVSHDYIDIKQSLIIEQGSTSKKITSAYKIIARLYKTVGVPVLITSVDNEVPIEAKLFNEAIPYSSVDELINEKNNQKKPVSGQEQKFNYSENGKLEYSIRLQKGKTESGWSDPSVGTVLLNAFALRKLGYIYNLNIVKHQFKKEVLKTITTGKSKHHKAFEKFNITLDNYPFQFTGNEFNWGIDKNTEKVGSIYVHCLINLDSLIDVIFHNHAGGEYSDITIKGERIIFEQMESKPDLCFVSNQHKKIFVIEAKKTQYLEQGRKQILKTNKFSNLIKSYYKEFEIINLLVLTDSEKEHSTKCPDDVLLIYRNGKEPLINNSYKYLFN